MILRHNGKDATGSKELYMKEENLTMCNRAVRKKCKEGLNSILLFQNNSLIRSDEVLSNQQCANLYSYGKYLTESTRTYIKSRQRCEVENKSNIWSLHPSHRSSRAFMRRNGAYPSYQLAIVFDVIYIGGNNCPNCYPLIPAVSKPTYTCTRTRGHNSVKTQF